MPLGLGSVLNIWKSFDTLVTPGSFIYFLALLQDVSVNMREDMHRNGWRQWDGEMQKGSAVGSKG